MPLFSTYIEGVFTLPSVSAVQVEHDRQVQIDRGSGAIELYEIAQVAPEPCGVLQPMEGPMVSD